MKIKYVLFVIIIILSGNVLYSQNNNDPETVNESVGTYPYVPFDENSKIARLNDESLLKFNDNLPRLDGATALYPVYSAFANATYPGWSYSINDINNSVVMCNTTARAYENLINGRVDIIFCAEPSKDQIAKAAEKGIKFNMTPIGIDAFVFFVNKNNPINNITSEQVRAIYSGETTNWLSLNGNDEPIIAYQRPKDSGSQTILESVIMANRNVMEPFQENVIDGMSGMVQQVAAVLYRNYANAIGYSFLLGRFMQ